MSAPHWRLSLIGAWLCVTCITFIVVDSSTARSTLLLLVAAFVPGAMLLGRWNEERPVPLRALGRGRDL